MELTDLLIGIYIRIYYLMMFLVNTVKLFLLRFTRKPMPFYVYKVLVYNKESDDKIDITDSFFSGINYYNVKYFEDYYIEYRLVTNKNVHHRIIEDPKESNTFMYDLFNKLSFQHKYMIANILYADESVNEDVTKHVLKYGGCNSNFAINSSIKSLLSVRNVLKEYTLNDNDKLILMTSKNIWKTLGIHDEIESIEST